jgi:hypothetical protein
MASERQYYFIVKNKDITDRFITNNLQIDPDKLGYGLPQTDSYFYDENGFIKTLTQDTVLTSEEFQKELNQKLKYRQSVYYKNQVVEDGHTGEGHFEILEPGYYKIEMTGGGGHCEASSHFLTHLFDSKNNKNEPRKWLNIRSTEAIYFDSYYNWYLFNDYEKCQLFINNNKNPAVTEKDYKKGYYKIANESLILFNGEQQNFTDEIRSRIDNDNSLYGYATLFFEYEDRYNPLFRRLLIFENNSYLYKEFRLEEESLDNFYNHSDPKYYPENTSKINFGDSSITSDAYGEPTYSDSDDYQDDFYPLWNYTPNIRKQNIINKQAAGNSGKIFDIIKLEENYYQAYYFLSEGSKTFNDHRAIGSFLVISDNNLNKVYVCHIQPGKFSNIKSAGQQLNNFVETNQFNNTRSSLEFNFGRSDSFFAKFLNAASGTESTSSTIGFNEEDLNLMGESEVITALFKNENSNDIKLYTGKGLGSEGLGIKRDFNNLNYFSYGEDAFFKFTFLGPKDSITKTIKFNIPEFGNTTGLRSCTGRKKLSSPLDTFIEYRLFLDKNKEIDLNSTIFVDDKKYTFQSLIDDTIANQKIQFKIQRKSDNIQIVSFIVFNDIEINLSVKNREYNIHLIKNNTLIKYGSDEFFNSLIFEQNKGLNRSLFYLINQIKNNNNDIHILRNDLTDYFSINGPLTYDLNVLFKESNLININFAKGRNLTLESIINIKYYEVDNLLLSIEDKREDEDDNPLNNKDIFNLKLTDGLLKELIINLQKTTTLQHNSLEFTLSPGQFIYSQSSFNTIKLKINEVSSNLNKNYFLGKEGVDILAGTYNSNTLLTQNIIFIADDSQNITINLDKRQYRVSISQQNNEKLNFMIPKELYYPFENVVIYFNLSSFYKFDVTKCIVDINNNNYNIIDFLDEDIRNLTNNDGIGDDYYEHLDFIYGNTNKIKMFRFLYNNNSLYERLNVNNESTSHGYFRNLPEILKSILNDYEKIDINFLMRHSDISLLLDVSYSDLSTIVTMQENEFRSIKINQPGFYRIMLAGGHSGNGGNGGDAGMTILKPEPTITGREDVYGDSVYGSSLSIDKSEENEYQITILVSKSVLPFLYQLNELELTRKMKNAHSEAITIFKNFVRERDLIYAFEVSSFSPSPWPERTCTVKEVLDPSSPLIVEYNITDCAVIIKNIKFKYPVTNWSISNFCFTPVESYLNSISAVDKTTPVQYIQKNTYSFHPPYNFHYFHSSDPTKEVHETWMINFRKAWNRFWFGIEGDDRGFIIGTSTGNTSSSRLPKVDINELNKSSYDSTYANDSRFHRIGGNLGSLQTTQFDPFAYDLYNTNGNIDYINWPLVEGGSILGRKADLMTFPRYTKIVMPRNPWGNEDSFTCSNTLPSASRPARNIKNFLGKSILTNIQFGGSYEWTNTGVYSYSTSHVGGWGAGFLLPTNGKYAPETADATNSKTPTIFDYLCYGNQGGAAQVILHLHAETTGSGSDAVTTYTPMFELHRDGWFCTFSPGFRYANSINSREEHRWPIMIYEATFKDINFGGSGGSSKVTTTTSSYVKDIVVKYGNGGGAGKGGEGFLKKSLSGQPGSSSAIGSWPDYDRTARNLDVYMPPSDLLRNLPNNERGGFQGLNGFEAFCFGMSNVEFRDNKISETILMHETLQTKIFQDQYQCLCFRGAYVDNIFYLDTGSLLIETGGKGGNGEDGFKAGIAEFGYSGGGGGAGCPSILLLNTKFFIYDDYYHKFDLKPQNFVYTYPEGAANKNIFCNYYTTVTNNLKTILLSRYQNNAIRGFNFLNDEYVKLYSGQNKLIIAAGGRAGDMTIIRSPYIPLEIRNLSSVADELRVETAIPENLYDPNNTGVSDPLPNFGGGGGGSSSATIINDYYAWINAPTTQKISDDKTGQVISVPIPKQFMGWEFNGLPGGNGGSGYIGGNGGNGGNGITGIPDTVLASVPVLQRSIAYGAGDYQKAIDEIPDLFGGGGGSSSTTVVQNNYHYYAYTQSRLYHAISSQFKETLSSYIGRARLIPKNPPGPAYSDDDLRTFFEQSFYLYDPSLFFFNLIDKTPGRILTLRGSIIKSYEYYRCIKDKKLFFRPLNQPVSNTSNQQENYKQVPGFGGGYNTFFYLKNGELTLAATYEKIILPDALNTLYIWEKLPAGGKPAIISKNILNILNKTSYKDIVVYNEISNIKLNIKQSNNIKDYNIMIGDRLIPLEGAGCKIIYLTDDINSKNLDTGQSILEEVYK